eukprot:TRINITY_DN115866_c0_g1_i1.p1 TRINITY_DN115866_c0_g1~~TRINITY_DN115866_c0_g1_i1.p1  ORF type:complete len:181 (-),score=28.18 TRINITY_DN115866_c0_g1_i1:178-720(-)
MTTSVRFTATLLSADRVELKCVVLPRKQDWLIRLLEMCPGPKAKILTVPDLHTQDGNVSQDQKGRFVHHPAGSWKVVAPAPKVEAPKAAIIVEAVSERSLEGAARTTVWLEKKLKSNGDTLVCETDLAKVLRLGPGRPLDQHVHNKLGVKRNEAFLQSQEELQREAKRPRVTYVTAAEQP